MPNLFESIIVGTRMTTENYLLCLAASLGCGLIAALAAGVRTRITRSFFASVALLPMIVATVIIMVNGSIGTGVAVMGAFSLIRFRSVPGKARDIVAIFLSMTAGLICASGYVAVAILFTLIVAAIMLALSFLPMGSESEMDLHITIPESLRFAGAFDDLFSQYTRSCRLVKARTTNMGSLYKLQYRVRLKNPAKIQEFIDALRCRNGNLEISLCELLDSTDEL